MGSFRPQIADPLCSMYSIRDTLNPSMYSIPVGYVHGTIAQCIRTVGVLCEGPLRIGTGVRILMSGSSC